MTLMNKLLKVLPKKQVDVKKLEAPIPINKVSQVETIIKSNPAKEGNDFLAESIQPSSTEGECDYEIVEREILPEKIICPDCGGITLEGLEFCDKCGGELGNINQ